MLLSVAAVVTAVVGVIVSMCILRSILHFESLVKTHRHFDTC